MDKASVVELLLRLGATSKFTIGADRKLRSKWSGDIEVPIKRLESGRLVGLKSGRKKIVFDVIDGRVVELYQTGELQIKSREVEQDGAADD